MMTDFDKSTRSEPALEEAIGFDLDQWFEQTLWHAKLSETMAQIGEDEEERQHELLLRMLRQAAYRHHLNPTWAKREADLLESRFRRQLQMHREGVPYRVIRQWQEETACLQRQLRDWAARTVKASR